MTTAYKLPILLLVCCLGLFTQLFAQSNTTAPATASEPIRTCATKDIHNDRMENEPGYKERFLARQALHRQALNEYLSAPRELCDNPVLLPMAVHFQGISNPNVACLRALAATQIQILNDDYHALNADISLWDNTAAAFFPGVNNGETCVEFCIPISGHPSGFGLAEGDPAVTINQFTGDFNAAWSGYINVFVSNLGGGILGYSPLGGLGNGDGVAIDNNAFGSGSGCAGVVPGAPYNLGRTLTHELGHYLNLDHIWADSGCGNSDGVADTPNQDDSYGGCPALGAASCGSTDMHMNYMDYTNDACMYMFSAGQSAVMESYVNTALGNVSGNNEVCDSPTAAIAFVTMQSNVLEGTSSCNTAGTKDITLTLSIGLAPSQNATVTFITSGSASNAVDFIVSPASVTFPQGSTANQTVTVTVYEDALVESDETIDLSYTINANGGDAVAGSSNQVHNISITDDDQTPAAGGGTLYLVQEFFENGLGSFTTSTTGTSTFQTATAAAASSSFWTISGTNSSTVAYINDDVCNCNLSTVRLISPVINLTNAVNPILTFDHAFADIGNETCSVRVSTDGGSNWSGAIYNLTNTSTSNGGGAYTTPWVNNISVNLSAYAGNSNVKIAFQYGDGGDWAYGAAIDNVRVTSTTSIQTASNSASGFAEAELGPNATIHFYDSQTKNIMATIQNLSAHNYGCTKVEVDRSGEAYGVEPTWYTPIDPEAETIDKAFLVTPEFNNPTGLYSITLYYRAQEISGWVSNNASGDPSSVLQMVKSDGAIASANASNTEVQATTQAAFGANYTYTTVWNSGFSGFTLGEIPPAALPVELISFEAVAQTDHIDLHWQTATELYNKGFHILRGTNPSDVRPIGFVAGNGTSELLHQYTFSDREVEKGITYYYQLEQVDFDGSTALSKMVTATIENKDIKVALYPNPVKALLQLNIDSPLSGTWSLVNTSGQVLLDQNFDAGLQQLSLDMTSYPRGVYWIVIQTAQERLVRKVVLGKG